MDRHKQQIKRDRQDLKRRAINSQNKSRMRTLIKNVLSSDSKKLLMNIIQVQFHSLIKWLAKILFIKIMLLDKNLRLLII